MGDVPQTVASRTSIAGALARSTIAAACLWFLAYVPLMYNSADGFGGRLDQVWHWAVLAAVPIGSGLIGRQPVVAIAVPIGVVIAAAGFSWYSGQGEAVDVWFEPWALTILLVQGLVAALVARWRPARPEAGRV